MGSKGFPEEALKGGLPNWLLKEAFGGSFEGWLRSLDLGSTVGINLIDRTVASSDRTGRKAERCGPLDLRSMAQVDRLDRTGRTAERFLAIGSDVDGCDLN